MEKLCHKCKGDNPKEAKYCRKCGARFTDREEPVVNPKIVYRYKTISIYKTPKWLYISLSALVIMLGLTIWYCYRVEDNNYNGDKYFSKILGEKEFLKINGSDSIPATLFQSNDNGEYFLIQTNVDYHIESIPKWCHITDSTSNSFKVIPYDNDSGLERTDTCYLVSSQHGKSIPIVLSQWGNCSAKFISLRVNYNSISDNVPCIKFIITFETFNMMDNTGVCSIFLFNNNNKPIICQNPEYSAPDGQFCVSKAFTPNYNKTRYEMALFIPKSDFYHTIPSGEGKVKVTIFDKFKNNFINLSSSSFYIIKESVNNDEHNLGTLSPKSSSPNYTNSSTHLPSK